jgi:hypothetical protein
MSGVREATNTNVVATSPTSTKFWGFNALFWCAYAAALMIPWLDRYSVLYMLPNKMVIASTGIAMTGLLRSLYRIIWVESRRPFVSIPLSLLACTAGAIVLDTMVIAITQGPDALSFHLDGTFGSIVEGVPMPGRVGQYLTLLIAWSLGHHLLVNRSSPRVEIPVVPEPASTSDSALSVSGTTVRARDGSRTILLERDEIDWIAADGDYIRLHCGAKYLLIRATMRHTSAALASLGFVRVHRSAIVNPKHVREIFREGNDQTVVLKSGTRVRAGRNYAAQLQQLSRGGAEN